MTRTAIQIKDTANDNADKPANTSFSDNDLLLARRRCREGRKRRGTDVWISTDALLQPLR